MIQDSGDSQHPLYDAEGIYAPKPPKNTVVKPEDPKVKEKVAKLLGLWREVLSEQAGFREEMRRDEQFYDGDQWTQEDKDTLEARHQVPLVFNHIKPSIDWLLGTERKTRIEFNVFPRSEDDVELAEIKTKLIKYVHDANRSAWSRSLAFRDAAIAGIGWLESGVRGDVSDDPIFSRYENWRYLWWDHLAKEPDFSDARFIFRMKYLDVDVAKAMYQDFEDEIERAAKTYDQTLTSYPDDEWESTPSGMKRTGAPDAFSEAKRRRVRMLECWYKVPVSLKVFRSYMPDIPSDDFDGRQEQQEALDNGLASLYDAIKMRVRVAMLLPDSEVLLSDMRSPYRHNEFPFTAVRGFRRAEDGAPYGVVRQAIDPQYDLNKRASKALFILSTNQVIAEEGAVDDWDELAEEAASPDGVVTYKRGYKIEFRNDKALAESHLALLDRDRQYVQDLSGVTNENLGRDTNAQSGRAVIAKQTQGATVTFPLFDNLRFACQIDGEKLLSLIEQYYDMPKQIRIVGDDGRTDWVNINQPTYDEMGNLKVMNDLAKSKADFVVDIQDFHATSRQALSENLMELAGQLPPEFAVPILVEAVDLMDLPKKEQIVAGIRQALNVPDPNRKMSPEEMAAEQAEKAKARAMQEREFNAGVGAKEAATRLKHAQAAKVNVETQMNAMNAGNMLTSTPFESLVSGDQTLREAGYGG